LLNNRLTISQDECHCEAASPLTLAPHAVPVSSLPHGKQEIATPKKHRLAMTGVQGTSDQYKFFEFL